MTTTARDQLINRLRALSPAGLHAAVTAATARLDQAPAADREAHALVADLGRTVLVTRPDRYEVGPVVIDNYWAQIIDRATGRVAVVCHTTTAPRWIEWYTGKADRLSVIPNDFRVCECTHLCATHASTLPDGTWAPGIGNGTCGFEGCSCQRMTPAIARPAVLFTEP